MIKVPAIYRTTLILVSGLVSAPSCVLGAESGGAWESGFTLAPYGWLAGFDGTVGVPSDSFDSGGGTILPDRIDVELKGDLEEIGFMFYADWRGERWMAYFDSVWVNVNQAAEVSIGRWLPGSDVVAEIDGNVYTLAVEYRVADWQRTTLSLYAGPRYYEVELMVDAAGGILPQPVSYLAATSWTDGIFGARLSSLLGENWRISALADLGSGGSTQSRQAAISLGYRLPWFSLIGGYRYLAVDYERAGLVLDFALSGPMVGISIDF